MSREKQMFEDLVEIFDEEYEKRRLITPQNTAEKMTAKGYVKQSENTIEVVRCKDCKHYKPQTLSKRWENKTKYCCRGTTVKVKDNDFCSYGEPKMKGGAE